MSRKNPTHTVVYARRAPRERTPRDLHSLLFSARGLRERLAKARKAGDLEAIFNRLGCHSVSARWYAATQAVVGWAGVGALDHPLHANHVLHQLVAHGTDGLFMGHVEILQHAARQITQLTSNVDPEADLPRIALASSSDACLMFMRAWLGAKTDQLTLPPREQVRPSVAAEPGIASAEDQTTASPDHVIGARSARTGRPILTLRPTIV